MIEEQKRISDLVEKYFQEIETAEYFYDVAELSATLLHEFQIAMARKHCFAEVKHLKTLDNVCYTDVSPILHEILETPLKEFGYFPEEIISFYYEIRIFRLPGLFKFGLEHINTLIKLFGKEKTDLFLQCLNEWGMSLDFHLFDGFLMNS
jgi:hypothetical protein